MGSASLKIRKKTVEYEAFELTDEGIESIINLYLNKPSRVLLPEWIIHRDVWDIMVDKHRQYISVPNLVDAVKAFPGDWLVHRPDKTEFKIVLLSKLNFKVNWEIAEER